MTLHKEGTGLLIGIGFILLVINIAMFGLVGKGVASYIVLIISIIIYLLVINFFRYVARKHPQANDPKVIVAPADGKVVVIEEVDEKEILNTRCKQVSIFMSIFNMHVNWIPSNGVVTHQSHTNGRFMAANLPKSSTENERSAVVIRTEDGQLILVRQIAGAIAQRIVTYPKVGDKVSINQNLGFIKFGSRVDLYLPLDAQIDVKVGQMVQGNITTIGRLA